MDDVTTLGIEDLHQRLLQTCDTLLREAELYDSTKDPILLERIGFHLEIVICFLERSNFDHDNSIATSVRRALAHLSSCCEDQMQNRDDIAAVHNQLPNSGGGNGRPKIVISQEQLEQYLDMDFNCPTIAKLFGVSVRTIRRRMDEYGLNVLSRYSAITDHELDHIVSQLKHEYPSCGYRMIMGLLRNRGIRVQQMRVRKSVQRVDPCGAIVRWFDTIHRRAYHVLGPLSLWHLDGNHKLIRYASVITNIPLSDI